MNTIVKFQGRDLYINELQDTSMDDIEIKGTNKTLFDYANGYCHLFAIALSDLFGYEICTSWDPKRIIDFKENILSEGLLHAYCKHSFQGTYYFFDAHGNTNKQEIIDCYYDDFNCDESEIVEVILTKEKLLNKIQKLSEKFGDYFSLDEALKEIECVKAYILENPIAYIPNYL